MIKKLRNVKRYQLYIGMSDKEKLKQLISSEEFIKMVTNLCSNYKIEFTLNEVYGGYITSKGEFLSENSLVLSLIGLNKKDVFKLSKELKIKLNQETIMISVEKPEIFVLS